MSEIRERLERIRMQPKIRQANLEQLEILRAKAEDMGLVPQYAVETVSHSRNGNGRQALIERLVDLQHQIEEEQIALDTEYVEAVEWLNTNVKDPVHRRALMAFYVCGKTQAEIADSMALSGDRSVRRVLNDALEELENAVL